MSDGWSVRRSSVTQRAIAVGLLLLVVVLALMPLYAGRAGLRLGTEIAAYIALATAWNLLAGFAGVMSIGQQAFVGLGAYALYGLAGHLGLHPLLAVLLSGLFAAVIALPVGMTLFRLQGTYFAIASWVVAEVFMLSLSHVQAFGGGSGMSFPLAAAKSLGDTANERAAVLWWVGLSTAVFAIGISYVWLRSPRGLALMAMRDNPVAASTLGVDTRRNMLLVYLVAAFIAGLAGAVLFLMKLRLSPASAFDVGEWTANIVFMVVIGGIGFLEGPLIGAAIFFAMRGLFADLGSLYLMLLGALAIVIMIKAPGGIWGFLNSRFGFEIFPVSRSLIRAGGGATPSSGPAGPTPLRERVPQPLIETNHGRAMQRHSSIGLSPKET